MKETIQESLFKDLEKLRLQLERNEITFQQFLKQKIRVIQTLEQIESTETAEKLTS